MVGIRFVDVGGLQRISWLKKFGFISNSEQWRTVYKNSSCRSHISEGAKDLVGFDMGNNEVVLRVFDGK